VGATVFFQLGMYIRFRKKKFFDYGSLNATLYCVLNCLKIDQATYVDVVHVGLCASAAVTL
jgi:hypothetical protein